MPSGETHVQIGGVITAIALFIIHLIQDSFSWLSTDLTSIDWILLCVIVYLYSQMPDIDADISVINKIWNTIAGLTGLYTLYTGQYKIFGYFAIASIVALEWVKHRGVTHEEWFAVIMAAPLWIVNPLFSIVAFISYISHIIADGDMLK